MDRVLETTGLKSGSKWYHVNDGFYFKVSDSDANRVYLKCVEKNCPCRATMPLTTEQRTTELFIRRAPHNHAPDNNWSRVAALRQRILQRCKEEVTDCRIVFEAECTRECSAAPPCNVLSPACSTCASCSTCGSYSTYGSCSTCSCK